MLYNQLTNSVCLYVRVCVRVCACVCVRVRVRVSVSPTVLTKKMLSLSIAFLGYWFTEDKQRNRVFGQKQFLLCHKGATFMSLAVYEQSIILVMEFPMRLDTAVRFLQ